MLARLRLAEIPLICRKCRQRQSVQLSQEIACAQCMQSVFPQSEHFRELHDRLLAHYVCPCGNEWDTSKSVEQRCPLDGCNGTMRMMKMTEDAQLPVAADCNGVICWEQTGVLGSDVLCRCCNVFTSATRYIGLHQMAILTALLHASRRGEFRVTCAQVGPVLFCTSLSACDDPQILARKPQRNVAGKTRMPTNIFDLLSDADACDS